MDDEFFLMQKSSTAGIIRHMLSENIFSPEPREISECVDSMCFPHGRATLEEMTQRINEIVAFAKKKGNYLSLWLETVEVKTDEWGNSEGGIQLWGRRMETPYEVKKRLDVNAALTAHDKFLYKLQRQRFDPYVDAVVSAAEAVVASTRTPKKPFYKAVQHLIEAVTKNVVEPQTRLHVGRLKDIDHRLQTVLLVFENINKKKYKTIPARLSKSLRELQSIYNGKG
jgi:hypothetical protein